MDVCLSLVVWWLTWLGTQGVIGLLELWETNMITREWFREYLATHTPEQNGHMIGRALVALHKRQTWAEQATGTTRNLNGVGFASCDARSGSLTAKSYMARGRLVKWQIEKWTRLGVGGFPRIAKYHKQLNEIAKERGRG